MSKPLIDLVVFILIIMSVIQIATDSPVAHYVILALGLATVIRVIVIARE